MMAFEKVHQTSYQSISKTFNIKIEEKVFLSRVTKKLFKTADRSMYKFLFMWLMRNPLTQYFIIANKYTCTV